MGSNKLIIFVMPVINLPSVDNEDLTNFYKIKYEFPYGAMSVSSFLVQNGVESFVVSLDCHISSKKTALQESKALIQSFICKCGGNNLSIGFSVNYKIQETFSVALINWFSQEYGRVNLLIGGSHSTVLYNKIKGPNHYVIKGEGEAETLRFMKGNYLMRHDRLIDNNLFTISLTERILEMPEINFELLLLPDNIKWNDFSFFMPTSRGCVGKCSFCTSSSLWSGGVKYKELTKVEREIAFLASQNVTIIDLVDDIICVDIKRLYEIVGITKNFPGISFPIMTRIDLLTRDVVDVLSSSNMKSIFVGIETTQKSVLREMNKRITVDKDLLNLEYAASKGLIVGTFWMIGHPGATRDSDLRSIDDLFDLIRKKLINGVSGGIFLPIPFTKSYYHPHVKLLDVPCELWTGTHPVHRLEDHDGNVLYHEDQIMDVGKESISALKQFSIENDDLNV